MLHPLLVLRVLRRDRLVGVELQPLAQAGPGLGLDHLLAGHARRHLELGRVVLARIDAELEIAALGDLQRVGDGGGVIPEHLVHLVAVFHVEAVAVELEAVGVVEVGRGADAQQCIVVLVIVGLQVVGVVRGDERQVHVRGHLRELGVHHVLQANAVALQLEVKAILE
jgi:hypothetical protein